MVLNLYYGEHPTTGNNMPSSTTGQANVRETTWAEDLPKVRKLIEEINKAELTHRTNQDGKPIRLVSLTYCLDGRKAITNKDNKFLLVLARSPELLEEFCNNLRGLHPAHKIRVAAREMASIDVKLDLIGARKAEGLPKKGPLLDLFHN